MQSFVQTEEADRVASDSVQSSCYLRGPRACRPCLAACRTKITGGTDIGGRSLHRLGELLNYTPQLVVQFRGPLHPDGESVNAQTGADEEFRAPICDMMRPTKKDAQAKGTQNGRTHFDTQ